MSTLMKFIGKIMKSAGKALAGLGWIVYVIIAALVALAYGAYGYNRK